MKYNFLFPEGWKYYLSEGRIYFDLIIMRQIRLINKDGFVACINYLLPREFVFDEPPRPPFEERPLSPPDLAFFELLTVLFEEEPLRPVSPLGVPEVFGWPLDWLPEFVFDLSLVVSFLPEDIERLLLTDSISISRFAFSFTLPEDRPRDEADGDEPLVSASSLILIRARLVNKSSASYSSLRVCSNCFATCSIPNSIAKLRAVP